jgi:uncharacterized protein YegP (UPF0339 family)
MAKRAHVEVYRDADGQFRWRLVGSNTRILCEGESHPTKYNAKRAVRRCGELLGDVEIVEVHDAPRPKASR